MSGLIFVVVLVGSFILYLLPSIIAGRNPDCQNPNVVCLINVFFGWSIIGWFIALFIGIWKPPVYRQIK